MLQNLIDIKTDEPELVPTLEPRLSLGERLGETFRSIEDRFPWLRQWVDDRLDRLFSSVSVSVIVHVVLLAVLWLTTYAVTRTVDKPFQSGEVDTRLGELETSQAFQDIDQAVDVENTPAVGSFAPNLSTATAAGSESIASAMAAVDADKKTGAAVNLAALDVQRATETVLPSASVYSQTVSIKGSGAEHVGSAEGAVDRLADEILRRLEKGRTLVVWAFDASGSLQAERERLSKHIDTIYKHVIRRDEKDLSADGGLLTTVVAFGQDRKTMTAAPTNDPEAITKAIRAVPLDETGVESTFGTVAEIVRKWGHYKGPDDNVYKTMVIVVTDEVGDDEPKLEEAIDVASKAKVPVYVLGSQALFGRVDGRMNYRDPKTGRTFMNIPVRQGPESVMLEQIRMPFWYGGNQYDMMDSGFGPYAPSRLAGATGGIFFVTRLGETRMGFDPVALREYKPDWVSRSQYLAAVNKDPIRTAVLSAAELTQQNLPGMPSLTFPAVDGPDFKEAMEQNQAIAARTAYTVDAALEPINAAAKYRDRETSRRWQAHFDLIRGRLLAMKVRSYEYNWACAKMKKDAPKFTKPDSNAWQLTPDTEIHFSDKAAAAGKQATDLLKKVVAEHPGTPWELLARRELQYPLGFKWVETYRKPIVRNNNPADEAKKKAMMKTMKPPDPPKL